MTPEDGKFGGRYEVIEGVGSGGMAEVYRARDDLLGREVAVKVLSRRFSSDPTFIERFRREAQAAANLNHPNIVSLYDYGSDPEANFIVMEYIDGKALSEVIAEQGALLPERAASIASDVAHALERAHASGLVHRDIKPANIMFTRSGQTKVTDFGIARALGSDSDATMTQTGMVIGTAAYLSPEQAQGSPVDARSDVYALGCVLYEMLTGGAPFTGDTPISIAYKHVRENPRSPSDVNPDVPSELDAITMKALAKHPGNRYQSAAEMGEDLQRFLAGQKVHATAMPMSQTAVATRPVGTSTEVLREATALEEAPSRRGLMYLLSALVLLAIFAVGAYLLFDNLLGNQVEVPKVTGLHVDVARERLADAGLGADIERRPHARAREDHVFRQDPAAGDTIDEGGIVTLFVSEGPRQTEVPSLRGLTVDEARRELDKAGLKLGKRTSQPDDEVAEGRIVSQSIAEGLTVDSGTEIDVVVSAGPEPTLVPNVEGLSEEAAIQNIQNAGLTVDVDRQPSDEPEGIVIAQDPVGNSEVEPGSEVRIVVSEGPEARPLPDMTGREADEAERELEEDYQLNVTQELESEEACLEDPGEVCRTDPEPGTPVEPGDRVVLYVQPEGEVHLDDGAMLAGGAPAGVWA